MYKSKNIDNTTYWKVYRETLIFILISICFMHNLIF